MTIEIGKTYRGLINGCLFKVIGLSRIFAWDKEKNTDVYFDIKILNPKAGEIETMSRSKSYLEHLQIEEVE